MQCHDFEQRLNDLLDRRLPPGDDRRLTAHARRCPVCRQLAEAYQLLLDETAAGRPECPEHLAPRIAGRWQHSPVVRYPVSWAAGWSAAAAVLVALVWQPWTQAPSVQRYRPDRELAAAAPSISPQPASRVGEDSLSPAAVELPHQAPAAGSIVSNSVVDLGSSDLGSSDDYWKLAAATGQSLSEMFSAWPETLVPAELPAVAGSDRTAAAPTGTAPSASAPSATAPSATSPPGNSFTSPESWASPVSTAASGGIWQIASGLRPVADSTAGAMSFLWNSLPQEQSPPPDAVPAAAGSSDST